MQNYKDTTQLYDANGLFELAALSVLGDREEQQDSFGYELRPDEGLVTVCDGMGGHNGGRLASSLAVDLLLRHYRDTYPAENAAMLTRVAAQIDGRIAALTDSSGTLLKCGTTMVAVWIRGNQLHWMSVGDSRIYLFRNETLVQATQDHVYQTVLDEKLAQGALSREEYVTKSAQGQALISFMGVNGLPKIDVTETPFMLQTGDRILLTSDGLYKLVSHEEIQRILDNFTNVEEALRALELKAQRAAKSRPGCRDNMTIVLIKVK